MAQTPRGRLGLALALVLGAPALVVAQHHAPAAEPVAAAAPARAASAFDPTPEEVARYREHVLTLANPYFEGRRPGTRGNERAAEYLEFWFREFGLKPVFPEMAAAADGSEVVTPAVSYRQPFPYGRDTVVTAQSLRYDNGDNTDFAGDEDSDPTRLKPGEDFVTLGNSGNGEVSGQVVFVGYGIKEGPDGFTSFPADAAERVKGKVAMVLRFEPLNEEGRSAFTDGAWSNESALGAKLRAVAALEPSAIILTSPPGAHDERIHTLETTAGTARNLGRPQSIPVVMVTMEAADRIVRSGPKGVGGRSLAELRALADKGVAGFVPLEAAVDISVGVDRPSRNTDNVAAVLPGKGSLADQYVVIGAHFDHVGDGSLGGSRATSEEAGKIHYGADDNASGTAGLLLSAERIRRVYDALPEGADARSVVFIGFSAEEIGLVGSRFFVQNCPFDAKSIYAMVNMDMIGRLRDDKVEVSGTGTAEGFEGVLDPVFAASGLEVGKVPGGRGPSDHASFYAASVPVLHFFTGFHDEYHTPRDIGELINSEGGAKVAALASEVAFVLSTRTEPLLFTSTDRPRSGDPHAGVDQAQQGLGGVRVRFGVSPASYSEIEPGIPLGEVFPNTSAAEAGIQKGDRLMKWNGEVVEDVQSWMAFLRKAKPGDEVDVVVKRDGREIPLKVKLKARESGAR